MSLDLNSLNENQRRAVLWDDGPLLVLASPGSGKTRVLTMRIARLLQENADASILAVTFTNKAAAEMRDRVDALLGQRAERAHLRTFHSYATDILRQHGSHVGLQPDFSMLPQDEDRLAFLEPIVRHLETAGHDVPNDRRSLLSLIDHLFRESYDGGAAAPGFSATPAWVPWLFEQYCSALIRANRQDFGSLLHLTSRLLRGNLGVARVIRAGWSHVCVDEFQDTNKAQYEMLKLLAPPKDANLFIVGDDDQIIYQWNGASPERLIALRREYDMALVQLPENYRCPPEIVWLANNLIQRNKLRTPDKHPIQSNRPSTGALAVRFFPFDNAIDEAAFVATDIKTRGAAHAGACVVLSRTTKLLNNVVSALAAAGLSPYISKRKNDFQTAPVRLMLLALRLANARHDRELLRQLCVAWETLSGTTVLLEHVAARATLTGGDFLRAWSDAAASAPGGAGSFLHSIQQELVERLNFPAVLDHFLDDGWEVWRPEYGEELADDVNIWRELHSQQLREVGTAAATINAYLQAFDLAAKVSPAPPNAVHCLTVHGSKGLEFKHVYLIGMAQEVIPSFQALKKGVDSREVEEERRNCFVAITRAQESLTVTFAREYNGWAKAPSQFIAEMMAPEARDP